MKFIYKPITNSKQMGKRRKGEDIRFLVIHDTGNESRGADAMAHYRYLQGATRPGSAHYYVDDKEIVQTIGDSRVAWAVGDTWARKHRTRSDVNNANSLSVELCINRDGNKPAAYKNLVELTKNLMARWHISADHVVRHFDASGKPCPGSWQANNWAMWRTFQADIRKPLAWPMDLTRSSDFGTGAEKKEEGKNMEKRDGNTISPWAKEAWEWAKAQGICDGTRPGEDMTREEMLTMLYRYDQKKGAKDGTCHCTDKRDAGFNTGL